MFYTLQKMITVVNSLSQRIEIKRFNNNNDMLKFLNKQNDNKWFISNLNLISGIYVYAGGEYHNIKKIDKNILNHL